MSRSIDAAASGKSIKIQNIDELINNLAASNESIQSMLTRAVNDTATHVHDYIVDRLTNSTGLRPERVQRELRIVKASNARTSTHTTAEVIPSRYRISIASYSPTFGVIPRYPQRVPVSARTSTTGDLRTQKTHFAHTGKVFWRSNERDANGRAKIKWASAPSVSHHVDTIYDEIVVDGEKFLAEILTRRVLAAIKREQKNG